MIKKNETEYVINPKVKSFILMVSMICICGAGVQFIYALVGMTGKGLIIGGWFGGALGMSTFKYIDSKIIHDKLREVNNGKK